MATRGVFRSCATPERAFPIAANDDAIKSIRIITRTIVDAIIDAQHTVSDQEIAEAVEAKTADKLSSYVSNGEEDI